MRFFCCVVWFFGACKGPPAQKPDAGTTGSLVVSASCPANLPGTGDTPGTLLTREGFACFGGCGPSCKAECLESTITIAVPEREGCTRCTYRVTTCKSHELCRWHDDCYRQCDLRWALVHPEAPLRPPTNPCYLNCDNPVVQASTRCGADWSQLFTASPSVRDTCWDGSIVVLSTWAGAEASSSCETLDERTRPWAPNVGKWASDATTPLGLPRGYSCTHDTDCPDPNQRCDDDEGDYPGLNGWGRCVDLPVAPQRDVTPLPAAGTRLGPLGSTEGTPCWFGYDCASGRCQNHQCRAK